ncbi:MAG: hypothetical protein MUF54_05805 [Polyangiaceae bacterium]|jgi:hypothetical protein|nr:hypothetical protein [Polyangiaceae bacterium]
MGVDVEVDVEPALVLGGPRGVLAHAEARVVGVRTVRHALGVDVTVLSELQAHPTSRTSPRVVA